MSSDINMSLSGQNGSLSELIFLHAEKVQDHTERDQGFVEKGKKFSFPGGSVRRCIVVVEDSVTRT